MFEKAINGLKFIIKNNLLLLPNIFKGNNATRKYVIKIWLLNNLDFFLAGLNRYIQILCLRNRFKKMDKNPIPNKHKIVEIESFVEIFYINMIHRVDRKNLILKEFDKIGISKFSRFEGIFNPIGVLGCAYSHKGVLDLFDEYNDKLLMVCEDDISFIGSSDKLKVLIENFINDDSLDVLCLGFNQFNQYHYNEYFNLTSDTQTTSCYVVKPYMKEFLLRNFELSINLFVHGIDRVYKPEIDLVWKVLQKKYNFVIPKERYAFQIESFSDIEKRIVNYRV
jgi:hypothetical protein